MPCTPVTTGPEKLLKNSVIRVGGKMGQKLKNGDPINFETLLIVAINIPGVKINREEFLTSALEPYFERSVIRNAVATNPACAGIGQEDIRKIADASIKYETNKATAISFAAGLPGGLAMVGTIPMDLAQYFGHVLRILQKLIYLYGWQELFNNKEIQIDDETANLLTLFMGVMFGVNGASNAIAKLADSAAQKTVKVIAQKALTKGTVYPVVKKVSLALGVKMTKDIFAKSVSKVIPVIGGIASGGLTYATYSPMARKLRDHLSKLKFADVHFYAEMAQEERGESVVWNQEPC